MNSSPDEALFQLALAKPAAKRVAFLDVMCEGDSALRQRLEALLVAHEQPDTLLATQADTARPTIKLDLADAPDEAVGQALGRYKLLERVGEGGDWGSPPTAAPCPGSGDVGNRVGHSICCHSWKRPPRGGRAVRPRDPGETSLAGLGVAGCQL